MSISFERDPTQPGFSETLRTVRARAEGEPLSLGELIDLFGPKGHAFITLFLVLPFLQPIPLVGLSSALGVAIAFVGIFMLLDRPPWLPERVARVIIEPRHLLRICSLLERLMRRLERWIQPRGRLLFRQLWFRRINGLILTVHASILALPLPIPFSNFFPSMVLLLVALGTLEEDARVLFISYFAVLINLAYFVALIFLPYMGIQWLAGS